MTFSVLPTPNPSTPNRASRLPARNEQDRQIPAVSTVHTPHLIFRLDMLCDLIGWHRNPFGRHIEAGFWRTLEADMAEFRAGRML